jgi:hypothetical protein
MNPVRISKKNLPFLCHFKSKVTMCKGSPAMQQFSHPPTAALPFILPDISVITVEAS